MKVSQKVIVWMRKWFILVLVTGLVLGLDQATKYWVVNTFEVGQTRAISPAIQPYLQLTRITNTGIAFGLGTGGGTIFMILSMCITIILFIIYARSARNMLWQHIGLAMVLGGALGNVIDRLNYGHVVDFVHIVIPGMISNVSNFADHAIVLGVGILIIESYWRDYQMKKQALEAAQPFSEAAVDEHLP